MVVVGYKAGADLGRTWGEDSDRAGTKQTTTNEEHGTQKITVSADWQTTCRLLY